MKHDASIASAQLTPPVAASVAILHDATEMLPSFILWATAVYTVLQIAWMIKKFWDGRKD
ncbi:MAG TPA: hypothetical protein VFS65_00735 [Candidatus Saccharimonadales bacterium]|nr:hypothetical protein [Candidatus Saccharimonadales bacterium]